MDDVGPALSVLLASLCVAISQAGRLPVIREECEVLDMSYTFKEGMTTYPLDYYRDNNFKRQNAELDVPSAGFDPVYIRFGAISMVEHVGTHVDAPQHVVQTRADAQGLPTIEQVPLRDLIGEACVVDIPLGKRNDLDYLISVEDLQNWEKFYGAFHKDCLVILRTNQARYWGDTNKYLGLSGPVELNQYGMPTNIHFPGLAPSAAQWLLDERGLVGVGADAISIDAGNVVDMRHSVHTKILGANKPGLENLANVDKLPARGATVFALPLKVDAGSGSPARVIAIGWKGASDPCRIGSGGAGHRSNAWLLFVAVIVARFMFV